MKKKGITGAMIGWILGIVVVLFVLSAVFFPEKLAATTRDAAFSVGLGELPEEKEPEFEGPALVPENIAQYFDATIKIIESLIQSPPTKDSCLIGINKIPELEKFRILLSTNKAEIIKTKSGMGSQPTMHFKTFEGFQPCIIGDYGGTENGAALNFKKCYVDKNYASCESVVPPAGEQKQAIIENNEYSNFLYKDGQRYCFIRLKGGLTDTNIRDNVATCQVEEQYPFIQDLLNKGYSKDFIEATKGFYNAVKQAAISKEDICKVEFSRYPGFDGKMVGMWKDGNNMKIDVSPNKALTSDIIQLLSVEGYQPCIVHGQNFWEWLNKGDVNVNGVNVKTNQHIGKTYVKITGEARMDFPPAGESENRDLAGKRPLIYKTKSSIGEKYLCIMPAHADNNNNCDKDTTDRNSVDDDCIYDRDKKGLKDIPLC